MAFFVKTFTATSAASLVSAVNTFLATLVNPTIRGLTYSVSRPSDRVGNAYTLTLNYSDGGAALATVFTLEVQESRFLNGQAGSIETVLAALYVANPAVYFSGVRIASLDESNTELPLYSAAYLRNATAGATANVSTGSY